MGPSVALNLLDDPGGQTPLNPDEAAQLIPKHVTTQGALNEWEQLNIQGAHVWLQGGAKKPAVLTEAFCRQLHRHMFNKTWQWAGHFRQSDKNIDSDWRQVPIRLNQLLGNAQYWLDGAAFPVDEVAARFHHALVLIHAFPNGNGRHARLMTDCLLRQSKARPFTCWRRVPPGTNTSAAYGQPTPGISQACLSLCGANRLASETVNSGWPKSEACTTTPKSGLCGDVVPGHVQCRFGGCMAVQVQVHQAVQRAGRAESNPATERPPEQV